MATVLSSKAAARSATFGARTAKSGSRRKLPKTCQTCPAGWSAQDFCTCDLNRHICKGELPQDKPTRRISPPGIPPQLIKGTKTFIERHRRVEYMTLKGLRGRDLRPPPRQQSPTHQGAAPCHADLLTAMLPEARPCWTEDFVCPAAIRALKTVPCKVLRAPPPTMLSPEPTD